MTNCTPLVIPVTVDVGTSQFAGPAESAQAIPATTVVDELLEINACGEVLVKTITKTYSSRSVANSFKRVYPNMVPVWGSEAWGATITGYGANQTDADNNAMSIAISGCPQNITLPGLGAGYTGIPPIAAVIENHAPTGLELRTKHTAYNNGVLVGQLWNTYTSGTLVSSQLTLYYLDVHEVWTYAVTTLAALATFNCAYITGLTTALSPAQLAMLNNRLSHKHQYQLANPCELSNAQLQDLVILLVEVFPQSLAVFNKFTV